MEIKVVGVVGGGIMGAGIAEVSARAGMEVIVVEATAEAAQAARRRVESSVRRAVSSGRLDEEESQRALARLSFTVDFAELARGDLIIEAAPEDEEIKADIFRRLDKVAAPRAILASNTSSIPLVKMAAITARPDKVVGIHFFNPVPVLPLVEIVETLLTGSDTLDVVRDFAENRLGKQTIRSKDRAGFIVNALLIPYLLSAIRMLESGFASAADIDNGMVKGCAHPMGPLALADLIGLDTTTAVAQSMYSEYKEQLYAPPPLLMRMVEAGLLGRKTKQGFFAYR